MSTLRTLVLLTINYIPILLWMFFFRMGLMSFIILLPVMFFAILMNALLSLGRKSAYLWCVHLFIASAIGILLQNYLYARFVDSDAQLTLLCFGEIFSVAVLILIAAIAAGAVSGARLRKSGREAPSYIFFDPALMKKQGKRAEMPEDSEDFDEFEENVLSDRVSDDELLDNEEDDEEDKEDLYDSEDIYDRGDEEPDDDEEIDDEEDGLENGYAGDGEGDVYAEEKGSRDDPDGRFFKKRSRRK